MTPKEIVERIKRRLGTRVDINDCVQLRSDIDHLLAIHAAVIALFDALGDVRAVDSTANILKQRAAVQKRREELEALCGWKAKTP